MVSLLKSVIVLIWVAALSIGIAAVAQAEDGGAETGPHAQLQQLIARVKAGADVSEKGVRASELSAYVKSGVIVKYSDGEIDQIADLLNDRDGYVRFSVAGVLGDIGPGAHRAEPFLQAALQREECGLIAAHVRRRMAISSIDAVLGAMAKIGIKRKPTHCPSGANASGLNP